MKLFEVAISAELLTLVNFRFQTCKPKQPAFCAWLVRKQTSVPHPRDYDGYPAPPTCISLICGEGSVTATKIGLSRRLLSQQECLSTASPVCSYFASKRRQIKLHLLRSQLARCCSRARRSVVNGDVTKCCFTRFLLLATKCPCLSVPNVTDSMNWLKNARRLWLMDSEVSI